MEAAKKLQVGDGVWGISGSDFNILDLPWVNLMSILETLTEIRLLPWQASGGSRRGLAVELAASPTGGLKSVPSEASLKSANDMIEAAILQGNNFLKVCRYYALPS
jgi:hypothetical protein